MAFLWPTVLILIYTAVVPLAFGVAAEHSAHESTCTRHDVKRSVVGPSLIQRKNEIARETYAAASVDPSGTSRRRQAFTFLGSRVWSHNVSECDAEVGLARLEKYQAVGEEFCGGNGASSFQCIASWKQKDTHSARSDDYLCHGSAMKLVIQSGEPIRLYGSGNGCNWALPKNGLKLAFFLFSEKDFVPLELYNGSMDAPCDENLDSTPLLLYSELDYWNPYINQAQAIMAYVSVAALDLNPASTRVLLAHPPSNNRKTDYQMAPLITGLYSRGGPSLTPTELPRVVCADRVVVPIGGRASFIRKNAGSDDPWALKCRSAPLLLSYGAFMREAFGAKPQTVSPKQHRVLVLVREPNNVHAEEYKRSLTNADEIEFALRDRGEKQGHNGSGITLLQSKTELLRVHDLIKSTSSALRADGETVEEVSPELLTIKEQVKLFAGADMVISAHSAALGWMSVLPMCAQVLEFCAAGNFQFVNYAKLAGIDHRCLPGLTAGWGTGAFTAPIHKVVEEAKKAKRRRERCLHDSRVVGNLGN